MTRNPPNYQLRRSGTPEIVAVVPRSIITKRSAFICSYTVLYYIIYIHNMRQNKHIIKVAVRTPTCPLVHQNSYSMRTGGVYGAPPAKKTGGEIAELVVLVKIVK